MACTAMQGRGILKCKNHDTAYLWLVALLNLKRRLGVLQTGNNKRRENRPTYYFYLLKRGHLFSVLGQSIFKIRIRKKSLQKKSAIVF